MDAREFMKFYIQQSNLVEEIMVKEEAPKEEPK